jgi:hypothetical protein
LIRVPQLTSCQVGSRCITSMLSMATARARRL